MLKIDNGDYVRATAGGLEHVSGTQELLARILMRLTARRGAFPFLPEFGSCLYKLGSVTPSGRESAARQYVTQALADEPNLSVTGVTMTDAQGRQVLTVCVSRGEEDYAVQMEVH